MSDDTFSASDFSSAETSLSSEPAAQPAAAPVEPSAPVETPAQPGEATIPPAAAPTDAPPSTEPTEPGPIPFPAHKTALDNARAKAVAEYRQQYGWAEQVNPQEFQQIQQIARHFTSGDPIAGLQEMIAEIRKDPQHDAALKSLAARALAQGRAAPVEDQEPQPDLQMQREDGQVVHLYSADQQAKRDGFLQRQLLARVQQELGPVLATHQQLQQREQATAQQHAVDHFVTTTYDDLKTWPGMDAPEAQAAVARDLQAARIDPHDPREVALALNAAYRRVVLPTLQTSSRQAVLNDINRQAAASSVNPAHSSTRAPKSMDEMSIAEALQHVAAQGR